jgi:hypothetical protein
MMTGGAWILISQPAGPKAGGDTSVAPKGGCRSKEQEGSVIAMKRTSG